MRNGSNCFLTLDGLLAMLADREHTLDRHSVAAEGTCLLDTFGRRELAILGEQSAEVFAGTWSVNMDATPQSRLGTALLVIPLRGSLSTITSACEFSRYSVTDAGNCLCFRGTGYGESPD